METKLNIAEILKDKPQGTKLYDKLYNVDVELDTISTTDTETVVWCTNETDNNTTCHRGYSEFGTVRGCPDGLQILKPSKEMRDWSKFAWKKGDVLVSEKDYKSHIIFDKFNDDTYTTFTGKCYFKATRLGFNYIPICNTVPTEDFNIEKNDTDKTYTNIIGEKLGGKLNLETLEIEKTQPEFKDGDIVTATSDFDSIFIGVLKKNIKDFPNNELRFYCALENKKLLAFDGLEVAIKAIKTSLATEKEKQLLFDALAKKNKAWDTEKKEIVDLKIKWTPKTFDRVITRDFDDGVWSANIFSHMNSQGEYVSIGCVEGYAYCLPYNEETAKLIGTTNNAK